MYIQNLEQMSHSYITREKASVSDKYFEFNSEDSSDTSSQLSSLSSVSEKYSDLEFEPNCSQEFSDIDSDTDSDLNSESSNTSENSDKNKSIEIQNFLNEATKLKKGNGFLSLFLDDTDEENEDEYFLKNTSPEEKKELLQLENEISKINHKRIPLRYQILKSNLPIDIKATAIQKLESIQKMEDSSSEYHKVSHWIDGLLKIPFNKFIETNISYEKSCDEDIGNYLINVKKSLDESVYGHLEAKSTLLEIVSSWITNPKAIPTVIGLQGPPGTGKTTLIKNGVAKALNRPFSMIALGGATDSSYLEGHGYTYEGSTWGRLVNILMETKCMNPVIFFDELDKVSETKHGEEIIGVLTHLIDYSQNDQISDRYFAGIHLDFSKCLFIFSFNDESKLNPILKDRIHVIRTESSNKESKIIIAKEYIIPSLLKNVKFNKEDITFTDDSIVNIIENYTDSEVGVRNLKRCLESIILKLNTLRLTHKNPLITSSPSKQFIPYYLNDYKLPMVITNEIVEKLLKGTSLNYSKNNKIHMMYV